MLEQHRYNGPTDHLVQCMRYCVHITIMIGLLIGFSFIVGPNETYAHHDDNDLIKTVFHVYVDGEKLGTVHHTEDIDEYLEKRITSVEDKASGQQVSFNEEIEYVSEKVFRPEFNVQEVIDKLDEKLSVAVEAAAIHVDGQLVGYLKDEEQANTLLETFKLEYVSKDTLNKLDEVTKDAEIDESFKGIHDEKSDATILDVTFSKNVTVSPEYTSIDKILKPEQILTLLKKGTLKEKIHVVEKGDVLGEIASQYNLTSDEIEELNPELKKENILNIGQEIIVTDYEPYLKVTVIEVETKNEKIPFKTKYITSDDLFKGVSKTQQSGKNGLKKVKYEYIRENGKVVKEKVLEEEILEEPREKIIVRGTKVIPSRGTGEFAWPTIGGYISSRQGTRWGAYHKGIDIARPSNRDILAADNGTVVSTGWDGGYGNKIVINHNNGYRTVYAHLSSIKVKRGQVVQRGQQIGIMGTTGNSTGIHLHFEIYKNGSLQNPLSYIGR